MASSVDRLLAARFKHILQDEQWIPDTIGRLVGGGSADTPAAASVSEGCDTRKLIGGSLLVGSLVGLLIVWSRSDKR